MRTPPYRQYRKIGDIPIPCPCRSQKRLLFGGQNMTKKGKKVKPKKIDGFSPDDARKIRTALRQVWSWSHPRRLVIKRCLIEGTEYSRCEGCKQKCAKIHVDHLQNVGEVDEGFIKRLFVSSAQMQGLCSECHREKTNAERTRDRIKIRQFKIDEDLNFF